MYTILYLLKKYQISTVCHVFMPGIVVLSDKWFFFIDNVIYEYSNGNVWGKSATKLYEMIKIYSFIRLLKVKWLITLVEASQEISIESQLYEFSCLWD